MSEDILFMTEDQIADISAAQVESVVESQKFLIFVTDDLRFGVDANYVVEIINDNAITYMPMMPDFIRGIINLRGQIIPIVDIRLRLGKMPKEDCLVIVLNIDGVQLGIFVDAVDQMVDILQSAILPMPDHSVQRLVSGMCSLPDNQGTMLVLDCAQLLPHE